MKIQIDHMNMTVRNLEETQNWYQKVFGFEIVESGRAKNKHNDQYSPWSIIKKDGALLCLYEESTRKNPEQNSEEFHQIYHYGIRISETEIEQWEEVIKTHKLKLYYGGKAVDYPHSKSWYIKDPTGYTIEVSYWPEGYRFDSNSYSFTKSGGTVVPKFPKLRK